MLFLFQSRKCHILGAFHPLALPDLLFRYKYGTEGCNYAVITIGNSTKHISTILLFYKPQVWSLFMYLALYIARATIFCTMCQKC